MLKLTNLDIKTRNTLLSGFNYTFNSGNLYGLVATNGSGKTTFFRAIAKLIKINDKSISIDNNSSIFYFETNEWFDQNLTGFDYLKFFKKEYNSNVDESEVIKFWNMEDYIKIPIKKYSLGMKQRVLIALYQITNSDIMLMDEITNGLDEESRALLFSLLNDFKRAGKTIILSSHYKEDIIHHSDYLMSLENRKMEVKKL